MYTTVITKIDTLPKISRHLFNVAFSTFFFKFFSQNCHLVGAASLLSDSSSFNVLGSAYDFLSYTNKNWQNAY